MRISLKPFVIAAAVPLIGGGAIMMMTATASASGSITVTPSTGLTGGQIVKVSGSGFAHSSIGALLQCNSDAKQPTIVVLANNIPVSCTSPTAHPFISTTATGALPTTNWTVIQGTVGPPGTGTDSAGHSAAADAALYPCPPTPAQQALGDTCVIAYGDFAGDQAIAQILYSGESPPTTTTTAPGQTTTTTAHVTTTTAHVTTTTAHVTTTTAAVLGVQVARGSTLPVTGAGRRLLGLAVIGLGFVVLGAALSTGGRRAVRRSTRR